MNLTKYGLGLLVFPLLFLFSSISVSAQSDGSQQLEPSFEIALHVVIGSNDGASRAEGVPKRSQRVAGHAVFPCSRGETQAEHARLCS